MPRDCPVERWISLASMRRVPMTNKTFFYASSLLIVPVLFVGFYGVRFLGRVYAIDQWVPKWDTLLILATMVVLERIYTYRYAVSQRSVQARDVISNVVNLYVTGALTGMIVLPVLAFFPGDFFGRHAGLVSPAQFGPGWLQGFSVPLSVPFLSFLMPAFATQCPFLM